jgi:polysaccharide chain length determinant protein (PEP-CTERM system associated)
MLPGKRYVMQDYVDIARRRWPLFVVLPAVTSFLALVYSSTIPDRYQSDILIAIVQQQVPDNFVRSTVTTTPEDQLQAISVRVRSRALLEQLIDEFQLFPGQRERLAQEQLVQLMNDNIEVELERRPGARESEAPSAFHVRFTYTDPEVAARVTQRIGSLFVNQNARDRGAQVQATDEFLETQLIRAREELEAQERRVEAFRARNGQALPTQMPSNLQGVQSTQLQIQALVESTARDRDRKLMLERLYTEAEREPLPIEPEQRVQTEQTSVAVSPGAPAEQQLAAARTNLAALQRRLEPEHPDVIRARRVIAELEVKVAAEAAAPKSADAAVTTTPAEAQRRERLRQMAAEIESLDRQIQFKESEEVRLRSIAGEYQRRIEAVPGIESEWAVLTRDYETLQTAYRELLNKSEQAKLSIQLEQQKMGDQFRILDNARVPMTPIGAVRLQINLIGLGIGLLLGLAVVALLELRDASFRSETDVYETLSLPVLTVVPYVETARARARHARNRLWLTAATVLATTGAGYVFWSLQLWKSIV